MGQENDPMEPTTTNNTEPINKAYVSTLVMETLFQ